MIDDALIFGDAPKAILIVGHRRPAGVKDDLSPSTVSGRRLEKLLGLRKGALLRAVDTVNLLGPHDDATPDRMRTAAGLVDLDGRELLVLCGRLVHQAFGHADGAMLNEGESVIIRGVTAVLMPHPSGNSRVWNDPNMTAKCRAALEVYAAGLIEPRLLQTDEQVQKARAVVARTRSWRDEVVKHVTQHGVITVAARQVGVNHNTVAAHMARDPEFRRQIADAREQCLDYAEMEVVRRGVAGYEGRPVVYHDVAVVRDAAGKVVEGRDGRPVTARVAKFKSVKEYDTTLLLRFLSRHRPAWSERRKTQIEGGLTFKDLAEAALAAEEEPDGGEE